MNSVFQGLNTRVVQKVMPHIFFLGNYSFRMYEIHAQYNWMFPLHVLFFHIISIYVLTDMATRTGNELVQGGMHALVSLWRKAVDVDGDYVEK
jgi:hypothetical protein